MGVERRSRVVALKIAGSTRRDCAVRPVVETAAARPTRTTALMLSAVRFAAWVLGHCAGLCTGRADLIRSKTQAKAGAVRPV
jgi:hypothetical protein